MDKYNWFENHEGELGFTVRHTEGDVETLIAITDTAEKAHLIVTTLNGFGKVSMTLEELNAEVEEILKPYYKQNKGGLQEWIDYEHVHKVVFNQLKEKNLLTQLYDGVVQNWKEAEEDSRDLQKQVELKETSNTILLLENRDLKKWKEEQLASTPDMQALAKVMKVPLGETVHDKIIPYIEKLQDQLFPGAFLCWVHSNGWHKHSSGEYYYKSKDFHQWPPDEAKEIEELKKEFKALYKL